MKNISDQILFAYNDKDFCAELIKPGSKNYINIIEMIMSTTARPMGLLADRSGTFNGRYKTVTNEIPSLWENGQEKSFDEISYERTKELIALDKKIIVGWSGGIDSTYTLIQFLKNMNDLSQIKVLMSEKSIIEYPNFFKNHIEGKLNYEIPDRYFAQIKAADDEIIVTGDQIPQIFNMAFIDGHPNANDPWFPWVDSKFSSNVQRQWFFDNIKPWLEKCPIEIKTVSDYVWWVTFSLRWNNGRYRALRYNKTYTKSDFFKTHSFFRTDDFQRWSVKNHKEKTGPNGHFKEVMKDYILSFDKDQDYYDSKTSTRSSGPSFQGKNSIVNKTKLVKLDEIPILVDDEYEKFFYNEVKENSKEFEKILYEINGSEWFPDVETNFDKSDWYEGYAKI